MEATTVNTIVASVAPSMSEVGIHAYGSAPALPADEEEASI
jgi:hypothetical protein